MAGLGQSQKPPCPPQIAPILERRCSFCTQAAAWNPVGGVNFPTLPWADLAGQRPQKVPGAWQRESRSTAAPGCRRGRSQPRRARWSPRPQSPSLAHGSVTQCAQPRSQWGGWADPGAAVGGRF